MIELGKELRDKVTGVKGIAVSRTEFINGCVRYTIQPKPLKKDGSIPAELWFDEKQLEVVGSGIKMEQKRTGGPTTCSPPVGLRA
jgi:hypothetical protein